MDFRVCVGIISFWFAQSTSQTVPARVTSLTLNGHASLITNPVLRNQTVTVICTWEHVYPPATVRLIDKHEKVLLTYNDKNGKLTYEIPSVRCNDAGTFRCEASGSSGNLSAVLLVQCPPEFLDTTKEEVTVFPGRTFSLAFPVHMYPTQITECEIARYSFVDDKNPNEVFIYGKRVCTIIDQGQGDQTYKVIPSKDVKRCICSVNGTAPYLTFNLDVYDIFIEDEGHWRATLANHEGQGNVHYFLIVIKDENGNSAAAAIATIVSVIIIITIIILVKKEIIPFERLTCRRHTESILLRPLEAVSVNPTPQHGSHMYSDIIERPEVTGMSTDLCSLSLNPQTTKSSKSFDANVPHVTEKCLATGQDDYISICSESELDRTSQKTDYLIPVTQNPPILFDQPTMPADSECVEN